MGVVPWGAIIGAGSSLLGGILNRNENRRNRQATEPAAIRAKAEAAGFNPREFIGAAFQQPAMLPGIGSAIMDAGALAFQEHNAQRAHEVQIAELEMANRRLTAMAEAATLRPTYSGPYQRGGNENSGNVRGSTDPASGVGGSDRGTSRVDDDPLTGSPGDTRDDLEPQRELDVSPYVSNPSVHEMTIPGLDRPLVMPGPEEVPGLDEVLVAAPVALPQIIYRGIRDGVPQLIERVRETAPYRQRLNERVRQEREERANQMDEILRPGWDAGWLSDGLPPAR